jgi:hypothetical protein
LHRLTGEEEPYTWNVDMLQKYFVWSCREQPLSSEVWSCPKGKDFFIISRNYFSMRKQFQ